MLLEAGGKYLERREIMNIFAQNLKKIYPGLDLSAVRKEQEKYKSVKMCNFKGCNLAFPDSKLLTSHRKSAHVEKKHDHSGKLYTCPNRSCHRRKKSKGFISITALREHQLRMQHWGSGVYHGPDGPTDCELITEEIADELREQAVKAREVLAATNLGSATAGSPEEHDDHEDEPPLANGSISQPQPQPGQHQQQHSMQPQQTYGAPPPQQSLPPPSSQQRQTVVPHGLGPQDMPLLPLLHDPVQQMAAQDHDMLHIDPAIQAQAQQAPHHMQTSYQGQQQMDTNMQAAMLQRYQQLQEEMNNIRAALLQDGIAPMQ